MRITLTLAGSLVGAFLPAPHGRRCDWSDRE